MIFDEEPLLNSIMNESYDTTKEGEKKENTQHSSQPNYNEDFEDDVFATVQTSPSTMPTLTPIITMQTTSPPMPTISTTNNEEVSNLQENLDFEYNLPSNLYLESEDEASQPTSPPNITEDEGTRKST